MFGYITIHKDEMKFREFDLYHAYYCGFCKELKKCYGLLGQATLSYDLTFVILLLTGLYEPTELEKTTRCIAHPLGKHPTRVNECSTYGAHMNLLLSYYKCQDDWLDEKKWFRGLYALLLKRKVRKIQEAYPEKTEKIRFHMDEIHRLEQENSPSLDEVAGRFGAIMGEILAYRKDEWESLLRRMGFYLGKFIYLMDAYEDVEKDEKKGNYNPFRSLYGTTKFEEQSREVLTMMMAECSRAFEKLPIVEHAEILRNVLYAGVWSRYDFLQEQKKEGSCKKCKKCKKA